MGALHAVCWFKFSFSVFYHPFPSQWRKNRYKQSKQNYFSLFSLFDWKRWKRWKLQKDRISTSKQHAKQQFACENTHHLEYMGLPASLLNSCRWKDLKISCRCNFWPYNKICTVKTKSFVIENFLTKFALFLSTILFKFINWPFNSCLLSNNESKIL